MSAWRGCAVGCVAGLLLLGADPSAAQTADFTGSLSIFVDTGDGLPTTVTPLVGSGTSVSFGVGGGSFTIPSGVFVSNSSTAVGFTPNASPNSIFTVRTITNTSNQAGSFSGSPGTGSYGGVMGTGSSVVVELGIVPLPSVFGTITIPVNVGVPGSAIATGSVLANAITVSVGAVGWTTGQVTLVTGTVSPPSSAVFSGTNSLGADGGTITLVTPFTVNVNLLPLGPLPGIAVLQLAFTNVVPEPSTFALFGAGLLAVGYGRRLRASQT